MAYNIMTCQGKDWTFGILSDCTFGWLAFAIVLFATMVLRRQCDDGVLAGMAFNFIAALILGLGLNILLITLTGSPRWSLLAGLGGMALGGFGVGMVTGGSE